MLIQLRGRAQLGVLCESSSAEQTKSFVTIVNRKKTDLRETEVLNEVRPTCTR